MRSTKQSFAILCLCVAALLFLRKFESSSLRRDSKTVVPARRYFDEDVATPVPVERVQDVELQVSIQEAPDVADDTIRSVTSEMDVDNTRPLTVSVSQALLFGQGELGLGLGLKGWICHLEEVSPASVVYSVGARKDRSWEDAMMGKYNVHIWAFNPALEPPAKRKEFYMYRLFRDRLWDSTQGATKGAQRLRQWMKLTGHSYMDVLKLDVEGTEVEILEDMLEAKDLPFDQLMLRWSARKDGNARQVEVIHGLLKEGFYLAYNYSNGEKMTFVRRHPAAASVKPRLDAFGFRAQKTRDLSRPSSAVPIVLISIGYKLNDHVPKHTVPLMCEMNDRVVLLTDVEQTIDNAPCVEVVVKEDWNEGPGQEFPWLPHYPPRERFFFRRWYMLRDWMRMAGIELAFTLDSDGVVAANVTRIVDSDWAIIKQHDYWIIYQPPRSAMQFGLFSLRALNDITAFWNVMFQRDVYTGEFVAFNRPNDMMALGNYIHSAVGKPYPCWGLGQSRLPGMCEDMIDYGYETIQLRMRKRGVHARFTPGTFMLDALGKPILNAGVAEAYNKVDKPSNYVMQPRGKGDRFETKMLRFWRGLPQMKLRYGGWQTTWAYVLEDEDEACASIHVEYIRSGASCACDKWCCKSCEEISHYY